MAHILESGLARILAGGAGICQGRSPDSLEAMSDAPVPIGRRYGGKSAAQRRVERRRQLLDAALALFGTAGYAATTIEQLCAEGRLNPRYFYEQFDGREALLEAVYDRHVEAVLEQVASAVAGAPAEPRARLRAGLTVFVDATLADERATRIEQRRREVLRAYADFIAGQAAGLQPPMMGPGVDPRLAAVALVGATDGLIIDWLNQRPRGDRAQIVTTLIEIFAPSA
jgi:AcrR family transcriptional regulator